MLTDTRNGCLLSRCIAHPSNIPTEPRSLMMSRPMDANSTKHGACALSADPSLSTGVVETLLLDSQL